MTDDLTCRTFDDCGKSICDEPARFIVWGHLYEKRDKGPKCAKHLPPHQGTPWLRLQAAIYEIPRPAPVDDEAVERAVRAACDEAGWDWTGGGRLGVPTPEEAMEPIVRATLAAARAGGAS